MRGQGLQLTSVSPCYSDNRKLMEEMEANRSNTTFETSTTHIEVQRSTKYSGKEENREDACRNNSNVVVEETNPKGSIIS